MTRARAGLGEEKTGPAPGQSTQIHTSRLLDPCKPKGLWLNITRGMASAGAWMFFGSNTHLFSLESQRMEDPQPALQQQGHEKGFSWENSYHSISQLGRLPFKPLRLGGSAQRNPAGRGPLRGLRPAASAGTARSWWRPSREQPGRVSRVSGAG